jgi:glycosyltransferase involved in cell wall biosynthesis
MVKAASGLTVSTETLKKEFEGYNSNICVVPNSIDFELWQKSEKKSDGIIRLGLFGSNTHYDDWKIIAELLKSILDEFPEVHLCFNSWFSAEFEQGAMFNELGGRKPQFPDYFHDLGLIERSSQVEIYEPCQIQDWPRWMSEKGIDIGLAPLKESRFNDCKSNLRYLEFGALRVAGIYSDVPAFNQDIKEGENGFLAKNYDEWGKKLRRLIQDESLRRVMGNKAWQDVKNRYDQAVTVKRLADFFTGIMGGVRNEKVYSDRLVIPA